MVLDNFAYVSVINAPYVIRDSISHTSCQRIICVTNGKAHRDATQSRYYLRTQAAGSYLHTLEILKARNRLACVKNTWSVAFQVENLYIVQLSWLEFLVILIDQLCGYVP